MTEAGGSRPQIVTGFVQARVVTDRRELRRLAPFMGQEATVSQAARALGLGVTAAYKLVRRYVALGLLRETRLERRAGRAVRHYCAPASFFVPLNVVGLEQIGELNRRAHLERFEHSLAHALRHTFPPGWGTLTQVLPSGEVFYELAAPDGTVFDPLDMDAPIMLSGWNLLRLSAAEARQLQHELVRVMLPYLNRSGEGGDLYLSGVFLSRDHPGGSP